MPLQATSGAASYDGFGGGAAAVPAYIEEVFSTYLYTGNGSTQTITNNIDLSTYGGLVWIKGRADNTDHSLTDTANGAGTFLSSNTTTALTTNSDNVSAFSTTGFTASNGAFGRTNENNKTYVSWTFREQPKFFDVVTYTGTGSNTTIAHSLGSVPGCIIVKSTTSVSNWQVYHRSLANTEYLVLNSSAAKATDTNRWNSTTPTSAVFSLGTDASVNASGSTYVAYIFAHDAGGFGLTGTDNVISCGVVTASSGDVSATLGYEPQFLLYKGASTAGDWRLYDSMRGMTANKEDATLFASNSNAESTETRIAPDATGFTGSGYVSGATYIYIAIRRGPMKVPTSGTSVYNGITRTGTGAATNITGAGFPIDLLIQHERATSNNIWTTDRLRGTLSNLDTQSTAAENTNSLFQFDKQDGFGLVGAGANVSGRTMIDWVFRRTPSVFDIVCYLGSGTTTVRSHNLTVAPELIIFKYINGAQGTGNWGVIHSITGTQFGKMFLNLNGASLGPYAYTDNQGLAAQPTTTTFTPSPTSSTFNTSANNYVAYLFATCAGVSKVGSYTGNGTTQTINCGFGAGGVRFVLIKRTDASGDWYVYDTARGMTALTDPYLFLNDAAVEVATLGSVTTVSTGFALNAAVLAAINTSAATYIFLAFA